MSSLIVVVALTFIGRLSYLQLFRSTENMLLEDPSIKRVYNYPERGYIYDRNGQLLVGNQPSYDVMVVPIALQVVKICSAVICATSIISLL